eukprot:4095970-Prymnesium_polylepis.1
MAPAEMPKSRRSTIHVPSEPVAPPMPRRRRKSLADARAVVMPPPSEERREGAQDGCMWLRCALLQQRSCLKAQATPHGFAAAAPCTHSLRTGGALPCAFRLEMRDSVSPTQQREEGLWATKQATCRIAGVFVSDHRTVFRSRHVHRVCAGALRALVPGLERRVEGGAVSYTHLTLPTICSV